MTQVLIADDDRELAVLLVDYLVAQGLQADAVTTAERAIERIDAAPDTVDVLVLDVMLPGIDGLTALRQLRQNHTLPILMLSGRGEPIDRVVGLELGAADYLSKPCLPRELLARINVLVRRHGAATPAQDVETVGALTLDGARRTVQIDGRDIALTGAEFDVLLALVRDVGQVISRRDLTVRGLHRELQKEDRAIDVHISRLRKKLAAPGAPTITSVRGAGYILSPGA
ncbi:MAG: response regulator transcription factor [Pseudomonadota bacterium]